MRALPLLTILTVAAPAVAREAAPPIPVAKPCTPTPDVAVATTVPMEARVLAKEPPAAEVKALYRIKDGCSDPLVTRTGIGIRNGTPATIARTPAHAHDARR